jgi:hypothetical protein
MKRFYIYVAALSILLASFTAWWQPTLVLAEGQNCFFRVTNFTSSPQYYRGKQGSTVVTDVILVPAGSSGLLTINQGVTGSITVEFSTSPAFTLVTMSGPHFINCANANNSCNRLGVDLHNFTTFSASLVLTVFKGSSVVFSQSYAGTSFNIQALLPTENDPNLYYTYQLRCVGIGGMCRDDTGGSVFGSAAPGTLMLSGTLGYVCPFACGPALDGAPLGRMNATVPLHWAPSASAASDRFFAEAGKTFKILGQQGGFTRIALACQAYWVPSDSIAQCADPLCR